MTIADMSLTDGGMLARCRIKIAGLVQIEDVLTFAGCVDVHFAQRRGKDVDDCGLGIHGG